MTATAEVEPWMRYADATRGDHFVQWAHDHCIQSVDRFAGERLDLEDWQVTVMREALAELGEDEYWGEAYWATTVLLVPKKNGKTSLLAAYALYELVENEGAPEVLLAAATDKQAGRLFNAAVRFVRSDPWLGARLVIREHEGQIAHAGTFGNLYRVSGDTGAAAGYGPSLVVVDELAEWT
ncbi:MAG TPA: terminase large subunit, partial [Myxococcaceae bacterium]